MKPSPKTRAFTLVELLVVIGIIALLISILLPSLSRAREAASRTKCLSNVRMIGIAMLMYTNDNKGYFPAGSGLNAQFQEDYVYWQQPPASTWDPVNFNASNPRSLDNGALVRYMGSHFNPANWLCPSDDPSTHASLGSYTLLVTGSNVTVGAYPYSYSMNYLLSDEIAITAPDTYQWLGYKVIKATSIRQASTVFMMVEESPYTINDGNFGAVSVFGTVTPGPDWLAVRHDYTAHYPDTQYTGKDTESIPNTYARGNVSFCDGHAEYVTREYVHFPTLEHWDPTRP
jgi:prepilin-type N-terminal cleavage/methylation domain-containing protein/prepilin-type processing-associated H-X9-DG protein